MGTADTEVHDGIGITDLAVARSVDRAGRGDSGHGNHGLDCRQHRAGYTITNVSYTLNGANSQNIDLVEFQAPPVPTAGSTMKIRLVAASADWYTCTDPLSDGNLDCTTTAPQATVVASDELRVVIAD